MLLYGKMLPPDSREQQMDLLATTHCAGSDLAESSEGNFKDGGEGLSPYPCVCNKGIRFSFNILISL